MRRPIILTTKNNTNVSDVLVTLCNWFVEASHKPNLPMAVLIHSYLVRGADVTMSIYQERKESTVYLVCYNDGLNNELCFEISSTGFAHGQDRKTFDDHPHNSAIIAQY
jgi:hypothetical protein